MESRHEWVCDVLAARVPSQVTAVSLAARTPRDLDIAAELDCVQRCRPQYPDAFPGLTPRCLHPVNTRRERSVNELL
jgi:hypothetical protein